MQQIIQLMMGVLMGTAGQNKQTSYQQALINSVVQLQTWSIKGRASLTSRKKRRRQCNERGEGPVSMTKKTDVQSPGYGDPRVSTPFSSLPTTHTLHPHMYLWKVVGEAPVCFGCKHLNVGSMNCRARTGELKQVIGHWLNSSSQSQRDQM